MKEGVCIQLYSQFSQQNLRLLKAVLMHSEAKKFMAVNVDDRFINVNVLKIEGDGNCLFASLVHQLHDVKTNSQEHKKLTTDLRQEVVQHIRENIVRYKQAIKSRLNYDGKNIDEACVTYLEKLSEEGHWGGPETILATSNMYNVNVLVFDEKAPFYLSTGFNPNYSRTIFLAYRIGSTQGPDGNAKRNHYDTICGIDEELLYKCAVQLSEKLSK